MYMLNILPEKLMGVFVCLIGFLFLFFYQLKGELKPLNQRTKRKDRKRTLLATGCVKSATQQQGFLRPHTL